ncbi:AadA family aminoglycoside 3''-O-nucleotidyltransferase [Pseudomonas sp. CBC3]|uniref:AadA family aminoglycoside 3''-O-nucleotidyltransferase n=1 Tax=Pseudomonas sp. CBC3 TaxID=3123318 RepID=UPI0030EAA310
MTDPRPTASIDTQLSQARAVIERHLAPTLLAIHLFGSALDGGLKPYSDIDLLVTASNPPSKAIRRALSLDLLTVSAPPGHSEALRPLEVTVVSLSEVLPWRYPARRELQFGEWLREDLVAGVFEPPVLDIDLAILLSKTRQHSLALTGPAADRLFEAVPKQDFYAALADTLKQWKAPEDWAGDERNIVLALARIWYSASTGRIAPKEVAAAWLLDRLPREHQPVLHEARHAYLNGGIDNLAARAEETTAFMRFARTTISGLPGMSKT